MCSVLLCNSVRKRNVLCEKKKCPSWEKELSSVKEETLSKQIEIVKIFQQPRFFLFKDTPFSVEEDALQQSRICFSCPKKGMFYKQEEHVLKC